MPGKNLTERVTRVEGRVEAIENRFDQFQDYCKETQKRMTKNSEDLEQRIDGFLNHEVSELKKAIAATRKMKRRPWGPKEWGALATTSIISLTSIIIAVIQLLW